MAGFSINLFKGMRPRISSRKLPQGEAETAQNVRLGSGDIDPLRENLTEYTVDASRDPATIFRYDNNDSPIWLVWNDRVDVARGPIRDDSLERLYYSGDTIGMDKAKVTTNVLADGGGGGPYPEDWLYLGVPAPTGAPTASDVALPEDLDPSARFASAFKTDEFIIDIVRYTVYPGTGTDNDIWRLDSAAQGSIAFDVLPGTSFRVTEVINNNQILIESATEPGITMRTLNADKSTINDWHPMNEQGSTKEADFIGWRVPPDMKVTIPGHELIVGDVIVVSAINRNPEYFAALTTDHYAQSWTPEQTVNISGTDVEQHEDERISASATSGDVQFSVVGSFYYDVDRASSVTSELEDRTYVYTYVNSFGEEGPPSPPSAVKRQLDGKSVLIENMVLPPTTGYDITKMRLYRTNSTEAGTEFQFVKEFDVSTTTRDEVPSAELGEVISSTTWDPPPDSIRGLTALPNGMMVGFVGKQLYMCEPYFPHAWPAEYDEAVDYDIVGIAALGNSAIVLTTGWPYVLTGSHPRNANLKPIKVNAGCLSKESIATDGDSVYYAASDGIMEISPSGVRIATEAWLNPEDWEAYDPATMVAEFYEGRYHAYWGFTGTPAAQISAEISGVENLTESQIVAGGATLTITLTNDLWVEAGTPFNNQRQAIIDGITSSSTQTLGWNNQVRDIALQVTDVVRTSDTVVTITLPAASGYAVTFSETQTVTIPSGALEISNSALVAGSKFTITPDPIKATVTIGGTVSTEAEVVAGGETVTLTLTNDTWVESSAFTDALKTELVLGLRATTDETNGWNDLVPQEIALSNVVRTSDTVVTITLGAVPLYSVINNETIRATVPYELLTDTQDVDQTSSNSIGIAATGAPFAEFAVTSGDNILTENEIILGGETITITLTNDTWIAAGTGPIGTTAQSDALVQALISEQSELNGWNNEVSLDNTDLVRTSATVATITLPAAATYSIDSNETIGATISADVLATSTSNLQVSNTFSVTAQDPTTAVLTGTVKQAGFQELDVVAGGDTIILTLSDDTWVAAGATFDAQRANIIAGLTAASSPTNGWNNEVRDGTLAVTDVVRTSDTVVTITLPATPLYNISGSAEVVTATIPATALSVSAIAVVASPTFSIAFDVATTAAASGTADNADDGDIRTGGKTIIITLTEDEWVAAGATFDAQRQNIIDGLTAASSPTNGWNNEVRDGTLGVANVVRTSNTVVTITLPATPNYEAGANESITVTVPASALDESTIAVVASNTIDITDTLNTEVMVGIRAKSTVTTRKHYIAHALDSRTSWDEEPIDTDTNPGTIGDTQMRMCYVEDIGRWIVGHQLYNDVLDVEVSRSDNDGVTWTSITETTNADFSLNSMLWHPDADVVLWTQINGAGINYSTDGGTNWTFDDDVYSTNSSAATQAGYAKVHYGGTSYFVTSPYLEALGGGQYDYHFMRSPDISVTPGNVGNDWTEHSLAWDGVVDVAANFNCGQGNGKTFMFMSYETGSSDYDVFISYITHNSTTENYVGKISGAFVNFPVENDSSSDGQTIASSPTKLLALNSVSGKTYAFSVDLDGSETTIGNWSSPTGTGDAISDLDGITVYALIYDPGDGGSDGLGFVAVGSRNSNAQGVIFTSVDDGATWTEQYESSLAQSAFRDVVASNHADWS